MNTRPGTVASFAAALLTMSAGCGRSERVGQACDLTVDAGPSQAVVNLTSGTCRSKLCLKPLQLSGDAVAEPPTGPTCTDECSRDSDCEGEARNASDPEDTRCAGGFVCGVPFVVGPLCCKHLCLCRDFLGPSGAEVPVACQGPDALASCQAAAGNAAAAGIGAQTTMWIFVPPRRQLDLVFMIDDSPSMAPKVSKLAQQFPRLIQALRDPNDGRYPDLRVAIINGDLGTGGAYPGGACGPSASLDASRGFGDLGNFHMPGAADCGVTPGALWLEYAWKPVSYDAALELGDVFGCLANNLGASGCALEHQLQSLAFALASPTLHQSQNGGLQNTFLRPDADLGLAILSDEDDCSAASNGGMFGDKPELRGEATSLRCATRAHQCGGKNLSDGPPGYPTSAPFEASFADCGARTDACPNADAGSAGTDTSVPTPCSPLEDVREMARKLKSLKADPEYKIMVTGIFGWPRDNQTMARAKYKIDLVPGPGPEDLDQQQGPLWDVWPVCYDPDHEPADPATFDAEAWAWGARGGLRLSAFIDEFGENGIKHSICERDFAPAMNAFGRKLIADYRNPCIERKLMDVDPAVPGLQPDCRVAYRLPQRDASTNQITFVESPDSLPRCPTGATPDTVTSDCWSLIIDNGKCPRDGQLVQVLRPEAARADAPLPAGTKIGFHCWACPDSESRPGCDY